MSRPILICGVTYCGTETDLLVSGGVVVPAPEVPPVDVERIEARGLLATPSPLVDLHVHFRDPGLTEKEDLLSGAQAAAAGGYSLVTCEPNTHPVIDTAEAVQIFRERVRDLQPPVSVYTKAAISMGQRGETATDIQALIEAKAAGLSDDGEPVVDAALLINAFRASAAYSANRLCVTAHCEETSGSSAKVRSMLGDGPAMMREPEIIKLHIEALAQAGTGRLHLQHVSLAASIAVIADAKRRGLSVTAEVTPHHLLLCADDIPSQGGEADANWKMNPPLRSREDMLAMRRALADGVIDVIATDHAPHTAAEKARGWDDAPFGVVGLETAIGACFSLVHDGTLTVDQLFTAMSTNPCNLLPPWIRSDADSLALIDPNAAWTVDPDTFYSKGRNTPFAGRQFTGKVIYTIARGRVAMADGQVLACV